MNIDPNAPAMPVKADINGDYHTGLTIRQELAARFMAAVIAGPSNECSPAELASDGFLYADAFIAEANKEKGTE